MQATFVFSVLCALMLLAQSAKVSPKLDLEDSHETNDGDKSSPKIKGVRVTVDTTSINKKSVESKSGELSDSDEGSSKGGGKKTLVRTDITFEITDDRNDSNSSSNEKSAEGKEDDNASIPVYKGTKGTDHEKGNRRWDDGDDRRWDSGDRRWDDGNRRGWHEDGGRGGSRWDQNDDRRRYGLDGPIFHQMDDENVRVHGVSDWSQFAPPRHEPPSSLGLWTTERNEYLQMNKEVPNSEFKGFTPYLVGDRLMKPCLCEVVDEWKDSIGSQSKVDNKLYRRSFEATVQPNKHSSTGVNGKLLGAFSSNPQK